MRSPLLALLALALLPGCDAVAETFGAPDVVEVPLRSAGRLDIEPRSVTLESTEADIGRDLPNLFDIGDVLIPTDALSFRATDTSARRSDPLPTCTVDLLVFVDGVAAVSGAVTVDQEGGTGTVTGASFSYADGYSQQDVCSRFPDGDCPAAAGTYSRSDVVGAVTDAVQSGVVDLDIAAVNTGACVGLLTVERLVFDIDY